MKTGLRKSVFTILFVIQLGGAAAAIDEDPLKNLCSRMLDNPYDRAGMTELSIYSVNASNRPALRSLAMSAYALSALATQDTNAFIRAKNRHTADFPEQSKLIPFEIRDCYSPCKECFGNGFTEKSLFCDKCGGTGKCGYKDCSEGHWIITAPGYGGHRRSKSSLPCPVCKGSGRCPECGGLQSTRSVCKNCEGKGSLFKCPTSLYGNYREKLQEILALLKNDFEFDTQFQLMCAETNLEKRLALCDRLLLNHKTHERIEEVRKIKGETVTLCNRIREKSEAERARIEKDIEILSRQTQTNPKAAIISIQAYVDGHHAALTESDMLALNALKNDCVVKVKQDEKRRKTYYLAGGLILVLMALSCINVHFYKYTLFPSYSAMGKTSRRAQNGSLTDPLTLTSKQNRTREKLKTAEIKPLDE